MGMRRALITRLYSLTSKTAAHNSSRGMVSVLSGATLEEEHNKLQKVLSFESEDLR